MRYRNRSATVLPKKDINADPHVHRVVMATKVVPVSRIGSAIKRVMKMWRRMARVLTPEAGFGGI